MKTQLLIISSLLLSLSFLAGCNSGSIVGNATGLLYEVVVTMPLGDWESNAGKAIKADLHSDVPGLPGSEPSMRITYAQPKDFNGLLTYVKNIVILNINESAYTKVALNYEANRWAQGQVVVTINAPSRNAVIDFMTENPRILANFFTQVETNRILAQYEKGYNKIIRDKLKDKFDILLNVPQTMLSSRDTTNFFWTSNDSGSGRTDLIVYTFPYTDPNTFTAEYLIAMRDSTVKANIPGAFPNSYMKTETQYILPSYSAITLQGKYCGVLRGLWKMEGDMMGGPFVSIARLDETNNRVVVVEGFVYAPETDKRNFIRRIEPALYTLRLPGEFENPIVESTFGLPNEIKE